MPSRNCKEWDFRFTLPINNWKRAAKTIYRNLNAIDWDSQDVVFVMMSGVEFGKTGRDTEKSYHIHAGLVSYVPISTSTAKAWFLGNEVPSSSSDLCTATWSQERPINKPYRGWRVHHEKANMKVDGSHGQPLLFLWGDLPEDDHTQLNADKILSVTREYAPELLEREIELIKAWNADIVFKNYRLPRSEEERAAAKKEYLKLYRANPVNKKRKREGDQARKINQYIALRGEYERLGNDDEKAPKLYCQLKVMETLPYVAEEIEKQAMGLVPTTEFD